jgi:TetR/AcrR family transcriptional repressor of nem operon
MSRSDRIQDALCRTAAPASGSHACAGPGRPRGFDAEQALEAALALFWRQGYEQTSLDELTHAMGLSRSSFYACFGSKHGALLAAVERYCDASLAELRALAEAESDPRLAARALVEAVAAPEGGRRGCFLANCVTELAPHDPEVEALGRRQLARIEGLLAELLVANGRPGDEQTGDGQTGDGQTGDGQTGAESRATALLSLALGATTLRKAGVPPERLRALLVEADRLISP